MIELDEIKRHDFLSDEARSGFGDDDESFGLGRNSEAPSAEKEQESEQMATAPMEVSPTDVTPTEVASIEVALMETTPQKRENSSDEGKAKQSEAVENIVAVASVVAPILADELPVERQSDDYHNKSEEQNLTEYISEPSNKASESLSAPVLDDDPSAENSISIADSDVENLMQEKCADEASTEPSTSKIPTAHEAYVPPMYAHWDTIITENASTDGSRKVITIPSAEEQRKEDAEKASAQTAQSNINTPRRNTWSRSAIAASLAGILLAALVASGYMLMRKTTIGSGAQNLWATLTGGRTESGVQDSAAMTLLDLTKKSQEKNALNNENQNLLNNTTNTNKTNSEASAPTSAVLMDSQTTVNAKPTAAQNSSTLIKTESSSVSSQNKPTTLAAKAQSATSQPQEKASPAAPTTKQTTDTKQTPPVSTTKQPNNQATKTTPNKQENSLPTTTIAKAKQNQSSPASALERKQTQQISGVFAIQVYATPSIADAEDWVERLKRRGMVNAIVTSQVVRGQMMYRVRFGLYNTLYEAERDAERFGYMGSWVVRLR